MRNVKIGDKSTFKDWLVCLESDPTLETPQAKTNYIDIPARNGSLDLSEALTNNPIYNDRQLSFTLFLYKEWIQREAWEATRQTIANYCNGRRMKIWLPSKTTHYLSGRISVGELNIEKGFATIEITANCDPFFYKNDITTLNITGTQTIINEGYPVIPSITATTNTIITINGISSTISAGTHKIPELIIKEGENTITATASIVVSFQEVVQ